MEFADEWMRRININPDFWKLVIWSDEAIFKLNGHVNRHDNITWTDTNPRKIIDRPFQSPGVMVWAGVFNDRLIGPIFFDDGNDHRRSIFEHARKWFMAGDCRTRQHRFDLLSARRRTSSLQIECTRMAERGFRWIDGLAAVVRSNGHHRSPDLTPLDFWLWGYLKEKVYAEKPRTIDDLKRIISEKMAEISGDMIERVCESVTATNAALHRAWRSDKLSDKCSCIAIDGFEFFD